MAERRDDERKFSEDIDRLLAGRRVAGSEDKEYQETVDFAARMAESREKPSLAFQATLKQHLLAKLSEEEARVKKPSFAEWLTGVLRTSTAWRNAAVAVTVVALALLVGWRVGLFSQSNPPIVTQPPLGTPASLNVFTRLDKAAYQIGETVEITLSFYNNTAEPLLIETFPPSLTISGPVPAEDVVRSIASEQASETIAAGETVLYTYTWNQRSDSNSPVIPGDYYLKVRDIRLPDSGGEVYVADPAPITILP